MTNEKNPRVFGRKMKKSWQTGTTWAGWVVYFGHHIKVAVKPTPAGDFRASVSLFTTEVGDRVGRTPERAAKEAEAILTQIKGTLRGVP